MNIAYYLIVAMHNDLPYIGFQFINEMKINLEYHYDIKMNNGKKKIGIGYKFSTVVDDKEYTLELFDDMVKLIYKDENIILFNMGKPKKVGDIVELGDFFYWKAGVIYNTYNGYAIDNYKILGIWRDHLKQEDRELLV
jgi:hypothetical protein